VLDVGVVAHQKTLERGKFLPPSNGSESRESRAGWPISRLGALASSKTTGVGTLMRRLGLGLIAGSPLLFLVGVIIAVSAI
jgi:hypothetical protein